MKDIKEIYNDNIRDTHWLGEVMDNEDPLLNGRCRIKVFGKFDNISTENLPWATPQNRMTPGSHAVPRVGDIVSIRFDNGDIYHPEYHFQVNQNDDLKSDILESSGEPHNVISLVYDAERNLRAYWSPENGLVITTGDGDQESPLIQLDAADKIYLFTENEVEVKAPRVYVNSPKVELGEMAAQQVIKGNTFQALFNAHTHTTTVPGLPTSPPVVPLTGSELSQVSKTQ
tara:strand:- start:1304 stop:1990 length:687 start_codon:yes stop_codon:yes gene_type:complete